MRPNVVLFQAEHLKHMIPREAVGFDILLRECVQTEERDPGFSIVLDGRILGAFGIVILWPGAAQGWAVFTEEMLLHGLWLTRTVERYLSAGCDGFGLRRIQADVRADSARNIRWIELLGFHNEGLMRNFGPDGSDYFRYALLRKG